MREVDSFDAEFTMVSVGGTSILTHLAENELHKTMRSTIGVHFAVGAFGRASERWFQAEPSLKEIIFDTNHVPGILFHNAAHCMSWVRNGDGEWFEIQQNSAVKVPFRGHVSRLMCSGQFGVVTLLPRASAGRLVSAILTALRRQVTAAHDCVEDFMKSSQESKDGQQILSDFMFDVVVALRILRFLCLSDEKLDLLFQSFVTNGFGTVLEPDSIYWLLLVDIRVG